MFKVKTAAINISKSNTLPIRQLITVATIWAAVPTVGAPPLLPPPLPLDTDCAGRLKALDSTRATSSRINSIL